VMIAKQRPAVSEQEKEQWQPFRKQSQRICSVQIQQALTPLIWGFQADSVNTSVVVQENTNNANRFPKL
jgi:hypothetical protein